MDLGYYYIIPRCFPTIIYILASLVYLVAKRPAGIHAKETAAGRNAEGATMQIALLLYRLSITFWTGGITLFTFILTPMLFKSLSRDHAGQIVGILFPGYFRWGLACGVIALASRLVMRTGELAPVVLLVIMLALTSFQAFYIEPRAAALKRQIPSFDTTPKEDPLRREFSKLHGVSASCNLAVVAGGIALVVML